MNTKTTTTAAYRGIHISPTRMQQVAVPAEQTWKAIQAVIGGHSFDVVGCHHGIDLYVDDEGAINGSPFNLPLTIIAHTLGHPAALFGDALALSRDNNGNTRALTDAQVEAITDAINTKLSPEVVDAVVATLEVHLAYASIVAMLKGLSRVRYGEGTDTAPHLTGARPAHQWRMPRLPCTHSIRHPDLQGYRFTGVQLHRAGGVGGQSSAVKGSATLTAP